MAGTPRDRNRLSIPPIAHSRPSEAAHVTSGHHQPMPAQRVSQEQCDGRRATCQKAIWASLRKCVQVWTFSGAAGILLAAFLTTCVFDGCAMARASRNADELAQHEQLNGIAEAATVARLAKLDDIQAEQHRETTLELRALRDGLADINLTIASLKE